MALALLDEVLAYALYFQGLYGVTARLEDRLRQAIPVGAKLIIRAWTLARRRLVQGRAEIRLDSPPDHPLLAEANATVYLQELEGDNKDCPPDPV